MNEHQELRIREIDLTDLIFYCLEKWRWVVACMLLFAIVIGGYKYYTVKEAQSGTLKVSRATVESEESEESENLEVNEKELLELQKEYMAKSTVMQMDPLHVSAGTLSFHMECSKEKGGLLAAYVAYVSGGGMAEDLSALDDSISVEDLRYLVSLVEKDNNATGNQEKYMLGYDIDDIGPGSIVFQIQVRMPNERLCEVYLKHVEELMGEYSSKLQAELSEHTLTLLDSAQSEMTDLNLQAYQADMRSMYIEGQETLQRLKSFNTEDISEAETANPLTSAVKYIVGGAILGAFLSCFILVLIFIMSDRLQNTEDFKTEYGMPLLGKVHGSKTKKGVFGLIDSWIFQLKEGLYAKICYEEQIKITVASIQSAIELDSGGEKLNKIMFAGTMPEKDAAVLYQHLTAEIKDVLVSPYLQILFQSSALKELGDYDGIIFLEKKGVSESGLIIQERALAYDRNIKVLGAVVLI